MKYTKNGEKQSNEVLSTLSNAAKGKPKSARYVDLFTAFMNRYITQEELNRVCFNMLELYKDELHDDRYITPLERCKTKEAKVSRLRAVNMNHSDGQWLEDLRHFKNEAGLKMSTKEQQWFDYVKNGTTAGDVKAFLNIYGSGSDTCPDNATDDDVPF